MELTSLSGASLLGRLNLLRVAANMASHLLRNLAGHS